MKQTGNLQTDHSTWVELVLEGHRRARLCGRPILVSAATALSPVDPLAVYGAVRGLGSDRILWLTPGRDTAFVGIGSARRIEARGDHRFTDVRRAWREILAESVVEQEGPRQAGPMLLGGFAFQPRTEPSPLWTGYPDALFHLPEFVVSKGEDGCWLTQNAWVRPEDEPDSLTHRLEARQKSFMRAMASTGARGGASWDSKGYGIGDALESRTIEVQDVALDAWRESVREIRDEIRLGRFDKVVLAREVRVTAPAGISELRALEALHTVYPECYLFSFAQGDKAFVGATPERLITLTGSQVASTALAGSIARDASRERDLQLGQALLGSAKDQKEHAIVVEYIRQALEPVCEKLWVDPAPSLLKLANVQHLRTEIAGRLSTTLSVLDLLAELHPTPAVAGYPKSRSLEVIRQREGMDRGWYSGPVGWVDREGRGEFAVAIRSALLSPHEAALFAGCGIVADSDPDKEYRESCLKLKPMLKTLERS